MNRPKTLAVLTVASLLSAGGILLAQDMGGMNMPGMTMPPTTTASQPASQPAPATTPAAAIDLANTVCPVSGDKVGDSKLTETYAGKIYHLCCTDCPPLFKKEPAKYAQAVAADPAKYGVKPAP